MAEKTTKQPHRVVVIGSGFGGLFGTKALRNSDVQITMIAKTTHHLFQPLLYQVATGILSEGEIAPPTREVLSSQDNVSVLLGEVTDIDLTAKTVTSHVLGRELETPYDSLIVAAGAGQSYFGNDQFSTFAPGMKSIDDALELRGRIFGAFELAEVMAARGQEVDHLLTFVVVGAGPTGVEMAGQIAELAHKTLKSDFRSINTRKARVILLDAAPQVLPPFGAKLGGWTQKKLEEIGVEVQLGAMVVEVDERGLEVQDKSGERRRIEAVTKVWAAGVQASGLGKTLAEQTGAALDRAGRIAVNPDLTLPGHPEVFVVGDMVALDNLPGVAQVAIQGARYAAREIDGRLRGKAPQTGFKYFDKGSMATISRFSAVATVGKLRLSGFVAWLMWLAVHLFYITGFKNQVTALLHWTVTFIGNDRSERTVTEQQIFAREALKRLQGGTADLVSAPSPVPTREELEERAQEEVRLTDSNRRGVKVG
ncbi:NAD(P)/FAD-dependent oxidoreductase [Nocardioides marmorisolisilvae]|uniref:NADH:ubiquinone reductase (non-electrogenic) n=1 Tax=Nocardioides marmorisolisilvae TaxID=1542737 RepID=A0A3N0DPG9_9ACTN|nr:NAD(P)/FAD-dependent oxidoreductase [Nocardioides marmorisolisilvae]RNL77539.1 NAD(P)/FAD-dependent oxidoreductase [Nocardioides marmorisolisilvae]